MKKRKIYNIKKTKITGVKKMDEQTIQKLEELIEQPEHYQIKKIFQSLNTETQFIVLDNIQHLCNEGLSIEEATNIIIQQLIPQDPTITIRMG